MKTRRDSGYPVIPFDETVASQAGQRLVRNPILVPNSYTLSFKNEGFNATQHDIIIATFEQLQNSMSHGDVRPGEPFTAILNVPDFGDTDHKEWFVRNAVDLVDLKFGFRYIRDERGNTSRVWGPFYTRVEDITGTPLIRVTINPEIFPVLTYFGKGVGGTTLLKPHIYEMENKYAKIFYEIIESCRGIGRYEAPLEDFRKVLGLSPEYTTANLKRNILEPMQRLFQKEDPWFVYELSSSSPVRGRRPKADTVRLWIRENRGAGWDSCSDYMIIYSVLRRLVDPACPSADAVGLADSVFQHRRSMAFAQKCRYYYGELSSGRMEWAKFSNTIRLILRKDLGYTI